MTSFERLSIEMTRFDKIAEYVRYLGRMTFPELVEANGMIYINMPDEDISGYIKLFAGEFVVSNQPLPMTIEEIARGIEWYMSVDHPNDHYITFEVMAL